MRTCPEIEPRLAAYVDGELPPQEQAELSRHLELCPPCRDRAREEQTARTVVRAHAASLCERASPGLRHRCTAAAGGMQESPLLKPPAAGQTSADGVAGSGRSNPAGRLGGTRWLRIPVAASLFLVVGVLTIAVLGERVEAVLAAQLTLEHLKCFAFSHVPGVPETPRRIEDALAAKYAWNVRVPGSFAAEGVELLGARRCLYGGGQMAHIMFSREGRPLSLFVLFDTRQKNRLFEIMGHEAIVWSKDNRTYALVGRGSPDEMRRVADYVRHAVQ